MGNMLLMALVLVHLPTELLSINVIVPESERSTTLFASVILRCDYSTSANPQDVFVTWRFKSFCKDPLLDFYSTDYQTALKLGQDPTNNCHDNQRIVRTVIQKRGSDGPMLGVDYRNRKITLQNKADLAITEVMWWDNGVYLCTVNAAGDTTGDSDQEVKLIVYHWLTILFIIIGALLLIILFSICCCQCCPQKCCCYVRCPCCPQTCCCPEKAVMQHRMLQEAMVPWVNGQPIYVPISSNASTQGVPMLYSGSYLDNPVQQNLVMPPLRQAPPPPPHHVSNSAHGSIQGTKQMLDYLENQVRGLDVGVPQMAPFVVQNMPPLQHYAQTQPPSAPPVVPYTPGPPSMLSALDEIGMRGLERRVITLPPIIQRGPSFASGRGRGGGNGARGGPRISSQSSGSTNRSSGGFPRDSRGHWRNRREKAQHRGNERASSAEKRRGGYRRSFDDLMEEVRSRAARRVRSYSPQRHKGSWSSDEEDSSWRRGGKGRGESENPPSYSSIDIEPGNSYGRRNYNHSDRSSRSPTSIVI